MANLLDAFVPIAASVLGADPPDAGSTDAGIARVREKAFASTPAPGKRVATKLLLVARDLESRAGPYNDGHLGGAADVALVSSWDEIAAKLAEYERVSDLTIFTHGAPNGFLFKTKDGGFTETTIDSVSGWYRDHPKTQRPRIESIHLQGCNVGLIPAPLVGFGQLYQASSVTAWNHFYGTSVTKLTIPRGATEEDVEKSLKDTRGYLAPGVTAAALATQPGVNRVLVEWYQIDVEEAALPPAAQTPGDSNPARKPFKPASSEETRVVEDPEQLQVLSTELAQFGFADPAKPLFFIEIKLAGFPQPTGPGDAGPSP